MSRRLVISALMFVSIVAFSTASGLGQDPAASVRQGPRRLIPGQHGVGRQVADFEYSDLAGRRQRLSDLADSKAVVVAMTSTSCPLSQKYLPTLAELARTYAPRGVAFVLVNPVATDEAAEMKAVLESLGGQASYVADSDERFARAVGAQTTTDVLVLDPTRTVVYHGAVDDQYGFGYAIDAPRHSYLAEALDAVLAGRQPPVEATEAPGCKLGVAGAPATSSDLTYHGRIARLVERHCVECHREGGVAPFALDTYEDVVAHGPMIREVVERGVMPPWFAAPASQDEASPWMNDRSLSAVEKRDLLAWLGGEKAVGDPRDGPAPREFPGGWLIGQPDAIYEFAEPVPVKATGTMPYQNVIVETRLPEDKWVQAIEVRPGDPSVVHHVLVFVRAGGESDEENSRRDPTADERMGYWGIYVPGNSTLVYPEGYAKWLPKGATLRFQMHYTPNGRATQDRTRIGLVFAKQPPKHEVRVAGIVNPRLVIPPGAANHQEVAQLRLPFDAQILAFLPHMHLRGKAARYEVETSAGTRTLLDIPRYDFNWQLLYRYAEPLPLAQGDVLRFTAWFDNSADNPANPDPGKTVRWGPQTYDEMHLGYVEYIVPGAVPGEGATNMRRARIEGAVRQGVASSLMRRLDVNGDGQVTKAEVRERVPNRVEWAEMMFDRLDTNRDGVLDERELARLSPG
ncbi:MAG: redoxin family protein [Pirellulaceae bacterium]|nr:redoxin family protein [Pirellulaceae bacterium]